MQWSRRWFLRAGALWSSAMLTLLAEPAGAQAPSPFSGQGSGQPLQPAYFSGIEFVYGPVNVRKGKRGCLVVDASEIRLIDDTDCNSWNKPNEHPNVLVAIQLVSVTKVTNTIEMNRLSASDVVAFALFALATRARDEYVFVTAETTDRADVVVFKVGKNISPLIITKIEFAIKKLKEKA